jgi:biopolymer transport protein ExbD
MRTLTLLRTICPSRQARHVGNLVEADMATNVGVAREGDHLSEINTTPLIDVMLVLLIMLIVTLPPPRHAVKLDTPAPCMDCERSELPPIVKIVVDFDSSLTWNGEHIAVAELDKRLALEARRPRQPEVHIQPHKLARYGAVAHVMAVVQREGLTKLGVIGGM